MKHKLATGILFVMAAATPWCQATTINFDNVASPTALSNQYAAQGVVFNQIEATAQFATSVVPVSSRELRYSVLFRHWPRVANICRSFQPFERRLRGQCDHHVKWL
jgi:hypothetical protein